MNTTNTKKFKTRQEAQDLIDKINDGIWWCLHGEYQRPVFKARKTRGEDSYYIRATYYYMIGTYFAKDDGPISQDEYENLVY